MFPRTSVNRDKKRKGINLSVLQKLTSIKELESEMCVAQVCAEYCEYGVVRTHESGKNKDLKKVVDKCASHIYVVLVSVLVLLFFAITKCL